MIIRLRVGWAGGPHDGSEREVALKTGESLSFCDDGAMPAVKLWNRGEGLIELTLRWSPSPDDQR